MKILVLNSGSSSLKYKLYEMNISREEMMVSGLVERIGDAIEDSIIIHQPANREKIRLVQKVPDHSKALKFVLDFLTKPGKGFLNSLDEIRAVGHRVLHGGEFYSKAIIVGDKELKKIESLKKLGPLHMPSNIMGIKACLKLMPRTQQVAVFDTAFHQSMPRCSFLYALPYEYYEKYHVRRYGFHGTSHRYVSERAACILGIKLSKLKMITVHLGNGSSVSAIKDGKCYDTSMGFTPLEGLIMGTRCGDIDPAIVPFLQNTLKATPAEIEALLNKKSGFIGMTGFSDMRDIHKARISGNGSAQDVYDIFIHRLVKYIGSYYAVLGGLDVLVFTAGIGENDSITRASICKRLTHLGIEFDDKKNNKIRSEEAVINKTGSKVAVLVVPTNEELLIARDSFKLVRNK